MLHENAFVVVPVIKATTLKITDKSAGAELTARKNAVKRSAAVVKSLIDPAHLKDVRAVQTEFRNYLKDRTVPWLGDTYLLPKDMYYEFNEAVSKFKDELDREVDRFIKKYAECVAKAQTDLGELFRASDYPDVIDLRYKFAIAVHYQPVPSVNQFATLGLESDTVDRLKAEALQAENDLLQEVTEGLYKRVHNRLQMLHHRLTDPETKRYRESLIEGLRFLVEVMPSLNIKGDSNLTAIMGDINKMLGSFTIDEVRENEEVRNDVAAKTEEIMRRMAGAF